MLVSLPRRHTYLLLIERMPCSTNQQACGKIHTQPSILDDFEYLGAFGGARRWRSDGGKRLYTWDSLHGEVEVFNARGKHLGALDPVTGAWVKPAVAGRTIDV
jgi:Cytotoxic